MSTQSEPDRIPNLRRRLKLAALSARKAATPVLLFASWAALSLVGPELDWAELDRWEVTLICTIGYGLFTAGSMGGLVRGAVVVSLDPSLRHVYARHLAPYAVVLLASTGVGVATFMAWPGLIVALWLGFGAGLSSLLACFVLARVVEVVKLRRRLWIAFKAPRSVRASDGSSTTIRTWPSISLGQ